MLVIDESLGVGNRTLGLVLTVVIGAGLVWTVPAGDASSAMNQCGPYTVTATRVFSGQQWSYRIRVQLIGARGIGCSGVRKLIKRF